GAGSRAQPAPRARRRSPRTVPPALALACPHQLRRSLRGRFLGAVLAGRRLGVALEGPHRPALRGAISVRTGRRLRSAARIRLPVSPGGAIGKEAASRKEEP